MESTVHTDMTPPYTFEPHVRLRDIDRNGHVNHPVYAEYFGEARAGYYRTVLDEDMSEAKTVIVHLSIDYVKPVEYTDPIIVEMTVSEMGNSSLTMEYKIVDQAGGLRATAQTVQVVTDKAGANRIPNAWRKAIREYEQATREDVTRL